MLSAMYVLCGAPSVKCTQGNLMLKINKKKHTFCCGNNIQSGQKNGEFIYKGQEKATAWDENLAANQTSQVSIQIQILNLFHKVTLNSEIRHFMSGFFFHPNEKR